MSHPCNIYRVARQCGVKLFEAFEHSPTSRKAFECYCKPSMREIGQTHGEDHLRLVLMLMTGTRTNAAELYADMIKAVSALLIHSPHLVQSKSLVQDFNAIDLGAIRRRVKDTKLPVENWKVLLVLIATNFVKPMQGDLLDNLEDAA